MSRTACCFLALGISVAAFAAACGDDSGDGGTGGSGGNGASGGSGGTGEAGSAGAAGSGQAGSAGTAGTGSGNGGAAGRGNGGTGGSSAGTAGTGNAGTAGTGTVVTDAGPDSGSEPDSGVVAPPDAGPAPDGGVNGDCNFGAGAGSLVEQTGQDYVISKVIFEGTTAHVTLRTVIAAPFADPMQLCSGPTDGECVALPDDGVSGNNPPGTEFVVDVPDVALAGGELAFLSDVPSNGPFALAYVNWGGFTSVDPGGTASSLEALGVAGAGVNNPFWTTNDSITLDNNDNAFFANGDVTVETGFAGCTATTF